MSERSTRRPRVWLFDLDNTLHDASYSAFGPINAAMTDYVARHLELTHAEASELRQHYWRRYGATLLGLMRHHGVKAGHFLEETHRLPGLEDRLRTHAHDRAALARLPGRKIVLTNAPLRYTERVLEVLGLRRFFDAIIAVEHMRMFGDLRPKPDKRFFRHLAARLGVHPSRCVLVEDTLVNQRAARSVGFRTVWMQRWIKHPLHGPEVGVYLHRRPVYVCARISSLQQLQREL